MIPDNCLDIPASTPPAQEAMEPLFRYLEWAEFAKFKMMVEAEVG